MIARETGYLYLATADLVSREYGWTEQVEKEKITQLLGVNLRRRDLTFPSRFGSFTIFLLGSFSVSRVFSVIRTLSFVSFLICAFSVTTFVQNQESWNFDGGRHTDVVDHLRKYAHHATIRSTHTVDYVLSFVAKVSSRRIHKFSSVCTLTCFTIYEYIQRYNLVGNRASNISTDYTQ